MRDGVTLNHQRRQELLVMDSEIRHLKKREAFMVTAGGWPITKLIFNLKKRPSWYPALIERDLRDIVQQITQIDNNMEEISNVTNQSKAANLEESETIDLF